MALVGPHFIYLAVLLSSPDVVLVPYPRLGSDEPHDFQDSSVVIAMIPLQLDKEINGRRTPADGQSSNLVFRLPLWSDIGNLYETNHRCVNL
jgi:hypothetical protein